MVQSQVISTELNTLLHFMHNIRQPYHTHSYFESSFSRTRDKSIYYSFNPILIKILLLQTTQLIFTELQRLLKKQEEIIGFLSECPPVPIPKKCPECGDSCVCVGYICPYYKPSKKDQ